MEDKNVTLYLNNDEININEINKFNNNEIK